MIFDCFMFFNELDLLEIRLNILDKIVDKFVLVEQTKTQKGDKKPLYYGENKERFKKFNDKIIHVVVDEYPNTELSQWTLENWQRNNISKGLKNCKDSDIIMISDLDEIPNPKILKEESKKLKYGTITALDMMMFMFYLNNLSYKYFWTHGTKILFYKDYKNILDKVNFSKTYGIDNKLEKKTTASKIRMYYGKKQRHIQNAGWHFTYIGGVDKVVNKLKSICEGNNATKEEANKLINSKTFGPEYPLAPVKIDSSFPEYIVSNQEKYKDYILKNPQKIIKDFPMTRIPVNKFLKLFIHTLCAFIPFKKYRKEFRRKYTQDKVV
ncbi:MAG TPA: hypothetical protein VLL98_03500 [Rickettsiales bacterium]|nr:hypothetical protein [Rickettsiales bacterium]